MEREFHSSLSGAHLFPPAFIQSSDEEASFEAMFSGVSLESFLIANHDQSLLLPLLAESPAARGFPSYFPAIETYRFPNEDLSSLNSKHLRQANAIPTNSDHCRKFDSLNLPKIESPNESTQPFSFLSDSTFNHLPRLQSLEHLQASSSSKRVRFDSASDPQILDSIVQHSFYASPFNGTVPSPAIPKSSSARQRRQKISDKTRNLQKLMPWDKKMDIATMLEEAYKYVKFLQAQISALQSMPIDSRFALTPQTRNFESECFRGMFGGLGKLNRQQLLQVLVNSPVAQTMLYSQGCCVFSVEQLVFLKNIAEKRAALQQMLFDPEKL